MLGGGFLQKFVIQKAKELGYYVYCLDANPRAVGFEIADESAVINIVDEEACLAYAREQQVDGVLTAATDFGVLAMSRIAQKMHLPGINYNSAKIIKNKADVRRILFDAHADDTGYSFEIDSLEEAQRVLTQIQFPVMMKPVDGSGSRGASKVERAEDFISAVEFAMSGSITHRTVAEPFVDGKEYGVESFVDNGEIHVLAVMQKEMTQPPYYAELGHAIPSGLSKSVEEKVVNCVKKALVALNVNHGSVNMDLLITESGNVHIIDVGARMGGNLIGSHIIPIGTGVDYMGNMIRAAVGDPTDWQQTADPQSVATKLLALQPGIVKFLPDFELMKKRYGVEVEHHLQIGDEITPYRTNLDGCGYVLASGKDVDTCLFRTKKILDLVDNSIVRK